MSDALLPEPDPRGGAADDGEAPTGEQEFDDVEDEPQPDVLRGRGEDRPASSDGEQDDFRTPQAGDRLDDAELKDDLRDE